MKAPLLLSLFLLVCLQVRAQDWSQLSSVRVYAEVDESRPAITLRWVPEAGANRYFVARRNLGSVQWGANIANLPMDAVSFTDTTVQAGQAYEYRVNRSGNDIGGFGYIAAGIKIAQPAPKKTILLLVDARVRDSLTTELTRLAQDLENESWNVLRDDIPSNSTSVQVRNIIRGRRTSYPGLSTVFIIGHVAVPYSGNAAWDGHPDHQGAWAADTYYADIDGNWTDVAVNNTTPARNENKNIPGDGKFDQSNLPSDVDLEVGRVDFFNMPALGRSEVYWLRNYLNKNHNFRTAQFRAGHRAVVTDNFNFQAEYFGSTGYKNFVPFFTADSVAKGDYRSALLNSSHLWSYGAGGGSYTSAGGISNTSLMGTDSLRGVFTVLFGSYFGDWDSQNNFLRSVLASGTMLTCVWAGRPGWQFHHMAQGMHIGFSTRLSMNNNGGQYTVSPTALRGTHMGLMGDPSLNMYPMAAPSNLMVTEDQERVELSWGASPDATEGYTILRKSSSQTEYRVIATGVRNLSYTDRCLSPDSSYTYLVCATQLVTNGSGSFYMNSPGAKVSVTIKNNFVTVADLEFALDYEFLEARSKSVNAGVLEWEVQGKKLSMDSILLALDCGSGKERLTLRASGVCNSDTAFADLVYNCSVPGLIVSRVEPKILCHDDSTNIYLDSISGAGPFRFLWSNGDSSSVLRGAKGKVSVVITSSRNTSATFEFDLPQYDSLVIDTIQVKGEVPGFGKGKILSVSFSGGVPPYTYKVVGNHNPDELSAGSYDLEVTDANGCTSLKGFFVPLNVATSDPKPNRWILYPNPASSEIVISPRDPDAVVKTIRITDALGRRLKINPDRLGSSGTVRLPLYDLPDGVYFVELGTGRDTERHSFRKLSQ